MHSDNSSAVIQTFLYSVSALLPDLCDRLVNFLVKDVFPSAEGNIFEYSSIVHLLEVCLSVASEDTFKSLHEKYFRGQLKALAQDNNTKFAVIKLLEGVRDKESVMIGH